MPTLSPITPVRADHRFIMKVINMVLSGKVHPQPSEFDRISSVFLQVGGSWERLFKGSPADTHLLKRIIKLASKKGFLTRKESWTGSPKSDSSDD